MTRRSKKRNGSRKPRPGEMAFISDRIPENLSPLDLGGQLDLLEDPRDAEAGVPGSVKHHGPALVVDPEGQLGGLFQRSARGLLDLEDHLIEGMDLVVEKHHLPGVAQIDFRARGSLRQVDLARFHFAFHVQRGINDSKSELSRTFLGAPSRATRIMTRAKSRLEIVCFGKNRLRRGNKGPRIL